MKRATLGVVVLAAAAAGFAGAMLAPAEAQSRARAAVQWEYAELTILGNDAVFWSPGSGYFLEGPDRRDPERLENTNKFMIIRPIRQLHLNSVGADGWEIVELAVAGDGETFLLRRAR